MPGQARVTIGAKSWDVYLATEAWELTQGLSGLASIDPDTGMFFDVGSSQLIGVTTAQMQFNIDVLLIGSDLKVKEIHRDVAPGRVLTATELERYILEVNANESVDVSVGDDVVVELISPPPPFMPIQPVIAPTADIWSMVNMMVQFALLAVAMYWVAETISPEISGPRSWVRRVRERF